MRHRSLARPLLLSLLALAAACSDGSPADTGGDAGPGASDGGLPLDGGGPRDATPAPDAAARPDAGPFDGNSLSDAAQTDGSGDESIRGTPLEGIAIEWSAPIELCTSWREGRSIQDELLSKAHVTVAPAPRPSLGSGHLSASTIGAVTVRRGPLADRQWRPASTTSALVEYRLLPQGDAISVSATLEHDLGAAGVLLETFSVYRSPGDGRPVVTGDGNWEHGFALRAAGIPDVALLEPCAGPAALENGIHVLVAESGGESVVLTRYSRTIEANAGSAPVFLRGLEVHSSDPARPPVATADFWAMTYAAEHHNWNETSHFDLSQDLAHYVQLFEPWRRTGSAPVAEALETLDLQGINGFDGTPQVTLGWRRFATGALELETWPAGRAWIRVDAAAVRSQLQCLDGQVLTFLDYGGHAFQALTCPRVQAPGFSLQGIIPVRFPEELRSIGEVQTAIQEVTVSGRAGFRITVGGHQLTLTKGAEPYYFLEVRETGGQVLSDGLVEPGELWPVRRDAPLTLANRAGDLSLAFMRRWLNGGVGESSIYGLERVEARALGRTWVVEAWDRLAYENTHHNWNDSFVATADDAVIRWRTEFLPIERHVVSITGTDGTLLLPDTELEVK